MSLSEIQNLLLLKMVRKDHKEKKTFELNKWKLGKGVR